MIDFPEVIGAEYFKFNDVHPDSIAIRFIYASDNIGTGNEVASRLNLNQMKKLKNMLDRYIFVIECGHNMLGDERPPLPRLN